MPKACKPIIDGLMSFRGLVFGLPVISRRKGRRSTCSARVEIVIITILEPANIIRRNRVLWVGRVNLLPGGVSQVAIPLVFGKTVIGPAVFKRLDNQFPRAVQERPTSGAERADPKKARKQFASHGQ
jgi:hypothetical protein